MVPIRHTGDPSVEPVTKARPGWRWSLIQRRTSDVQQQLGLGLVLEVENRGNQALNFTFLTMVQLGVTRLDQLGARTLLTSLVTRLGRHAVVKFLLIIGETMWQNREQIRLVTVNKSARSTAGATSLRSIPRIIVASSRAPTVDEKVTIAQSQDQNTVGPEEDS